MTSSTKHYPINDIFFSLQGEGMRAGTANVFVRFAGCNQTCKEETHGFDCDTEFVSNVKMTTDQIVARIEHLWVGRHDWKWIIFTGGEPALSLDTALVMTLREHGWKMAIETNGSINVDALDLNWITVSPKVAEHAMRQLHADELKYVRNVGQGIPVPRCVADYRLISPAFNGEEVDHDALLHCIGLVLRYPEWRLSVQQHKLWKVR